MNHATSHILFDIPFFLVVNGLFYVHELCGLDYFFQVIKLFVVGVIYSVQMVGEFLCAST